MKKNRNFLAMLFVTVSLILLTACGRPTTVEQTDSGFIVSDEFTPKQTEESAAESTPLPTQEPTPEPEPLSFAEEYGWNFEAPHEVTVPVTQYAEADYVEYYPLSVTLGAPEITCGEPDEEGYITYTVMYSSPSGMDLYFEGDDASNLHVNTPDYDVFDLYTGAKLPARLFLHLDEGQRFDDSEFGSLVEYDGNAYEVFYYVEMVAEEPIQDVLEEGAGTHLLYSVDTLITMTIRAPQEYDGLVIGLDFVTPAEHIANESDEDLEVTFWDVNNDPANWTFVRLSDYCTPENVAA